LKNHIDAAARRIDDNAFLEEGVARLRDLEHNNTRVARELLEGSK